MQRKLKTWFSNTGSSIKRAAQLSIIVSTLIFATISNAVSDNLGFESNFTDWSTTGAGWQTNSVSTNLRSGLKSIRLNTNSTVYRKIINSGLTKTVNDNVTKYVTFSIYVKADVLNAQLILGIFNVSTGIEQLQTGTSTATTSGFTEISFTIEGNVGDTYYPVLYGANSVAAPINIYFDDVQFYISNYNSIDATSPEKPTTLSAICSGTAITLSIVAGTDSESGIDGLLIIRRAGIYSNNPTVNNKTNYSPISTLIGPKIISGYTVVYNDSLISNFADDPGTTGKYTYLVYMRDKAGNYTSSTLAARIWVFNGTGLIHTAVGNTELDGLHLPLTCILTIGSSSAVANVSIRNLASIHNGGLIIDNGTLNNTSGGQLFFDAGSGYKYSRNGNALYPIVAATWAAGSNCLISGITTIAPFGTGQTFGNFTWDCTGQSIDVDLDASFATGGNLSLVHSGPTFTSKTVWLNGTTMIKGDIVKTGGALNFRPESNVYLNGTAIQNINIAITFHKLTIENAAGAKLLKSILVDSTLYLTTGNLNLNGFSLKILNNASISRATGSLSATPLFVGIYNLIYTEPVVSSFELTSALTKLNNVVINAEGFVTLTKHMNVNGVLSLINGIISTGVFEVRIFNSSVGSVTGFTSITYINGILNRVVSGNGIYYFPVGTSAFYEEVIIDLNGITGINNIKVAFNNSSPGLVPAGLKINGSHVLDFLDYGFWTVTPNTQPTAGSYNITCKMKGASNGPALASMYGIVKRTDNTAPWQSLGTHNNATQSISSGVVTMLRSGLTSFSDFAGGFGGEPLPISVSSFDLSVNNQTALLNWVTSSEINNDRFEIESGIMNTSGILNFDKIGEVSGMGTTTNKTKYEFRDTQNELLGRVYYRIKQIDSDGEFSYTIIKSIEISSVTEMVSDFYPNPVDDNFSFDINSIEASIIKIQLINSIGQLVMQNNLNIVKGLSTVSININKLPEGFYYGKIIDQNNSVIQNRIIIKN